jgi:DNA repair exonuclease SbcCD nuclease subunit
MSFRFVHTADWQLGKPFGRFDPELRGRLEQARLDMIDRLAAAARQAGAEHVLVAGDVWDQEQPQDRVLRRSFDRLKAAHDLDWWLLPGNHDPAGRESLWERAAREGLPAHIHLLTEAAPIEMATGVSLLPAPWTGKRPGRDLTADWSAWQTPADHLRIGIGHGGTQGFGSEAEEAVIIDPGRAEEAGLDYLALGDWHGTRKVAPRTWYSGTPEPDRFRNNDQGHALLVEIGSDPTILKTGHYDWQQPDLSSETERDVCAAFAGLFPDGVLDHVLVRAQLAGEVSLAEWSRLESLAEKHRERVAYLEMRTSGLHLRAEGSDLSALDEGILREVAEQLLAGPAQAEDADRDRALVLLERFARS